MNGLMHAHSGLRYLVLLVGLVATAFFLVGAFRKQDLSKPGRLLGTVFTGLFDLQVLVGLGLLLMRPFHPILVGHIVMMTLAAVLAHAALVLNRRRERPGHALPLLGVGGALLFTVGGIFAIGRHPLQATVFGG